MGKRKLGKKCVIHVSVSPNADEIAVGEELTTLCGEVRTKKKWDTEKIYPHCQACIDIILEEHRVMADTLRAIESASKDGAMLFKAASLRLSDVKIVNEDSSGFTAVRNQWLKPGELPPTMISAEELAILLDTDPKTARRFLRYITPKDEHPGKGGVWAIDITKTPDLIRKYYAEWLP